MSQQILIPKPIDLKIDDGKYNVGTAGDHVVLESLSKPENDGGVSVRFDQIGKAMLEEQRRWLRSNAGDAEAQRVLRKSGRQISLGDVAFFCVFVLSEVRK
jgi:hypothetical protein